MHYYKYSTSSGKLIYHMVFFLFEKDIAVDLAIEKTLDHQDL